MHGQWKCAERKSKKADTFETKRSESQCFTRLIFLLQSFFFRARERDRESFCTALAKHAYIFVFSRSCRCALCLLSKWYIKQIFRQHNATVAIGKSLSSLIQEMTSNKHAQKDQHWFPLSNGWCIQRWDLPFSQTSTWITKWLLFDYLHNQEDAHSCMQVVATASKTTTTTKRIKKKPYKNNNTSVLNIFSSVLQVCTTNMNILNSDPNKVFGSRALLRTYAIKWNNSCCYSTKWWEWEREECKRWMWHPVCACTAQSKNKETQNKQPKMKCIINAEQWNSRFIF